MNIELDLTGFMEENLKTIKEEWDRKLLAKDEDKWQYWEIIYCLLAEKAEEIRRKSENNFSKNE